MEISGLAFSGKLPSFNASPAGAGKKLEEAKRTFHLSHLNRLTAWSESPIRINGRTPYKDRFAQGATLVPRRLCFVDIDQEISGGLRDRMVRVKSAKATYREAKPPWKEISVSGSIHTRFLFRTILANNLVPFCVTGGFHVVLPVLGGKMAEIAEIEVTGDLDSARWFKDATEIYNKNITERSKAKKLAFNDRLDYQKGITGQLHSRRYAVLYNRSGMNAVSAVIDTDGHDTPFIYDNATYLMKTNSEGEAWYVCAFLNSRVANETMKPFQSRGQQGERDIHKKILEIPFMEYDPKNADHRAIAEMARDATAKSEKFIKELDFDEQGNNLTAREIGKLRSDMRRMLESELDRIDHKIRPIIDAS